MLHTEINKRRPRRTVTVEAAHLQRANEHERNNVSTALRVQQLAESSQIATETYDCDLSRQVSELALDDVDGVIVIFFIHTDDPIIDDFLPLWQRI